MLHKRMLEYISLPHSFPVISRPSNRFFPVPLLRSQRFNDFHLTLEHEARKGKISIKQTLRYDESETKHHWMVAFSSRCISAVPDNQTEVLFFASKPLAG